MKQVVCEKRKTYFAYIPKNGVESLLLLALRENGVEIKTSVAIWDIQPHVMSGVIKDGYNYISISRNPYNRLVSGYIDKFLTGNYNSLSFCKNVSNYYSRDLNDDRRVSFEELVNYLITQPKHSIDGHFATQISSVNLSKNPEIIKLENVSDIQYRLKTLGFDNKFDNYRKIYLYGWKKTDIKDAHKLYFKDFDIYDTYRGYEYQTGKILGVDKHGYLDDDRNHGVLPHYDNFYTDELREKVYNFYKEDFEYFGYEK